MTRYSRALCPNYQAAVNLIGKRWTGLVLLILMDGPARFGELLEKLEVVGDRILSERLKELEAEGVVERRVLPTHPVRVEYELTEKGRALAPVIDALAKWGDTWVSIDPKQAAEFEAAADAEEAEEKTPSRRTKRKAAGAA
ncbi:winged helix-turn-helix transcriptional regulator [Pendulispora albinea]|uniref:Helix-turn-helix transcriptional regulator n=1 Tax=Pendulispora albinea TaxID=2741071 RepID=A0ABZ2LQD6_9BACT